MVDLRCAVDGELQAWRDVTDAELERLVAALGEDGVEQLRGELERMERSVCRALDLAQAGLVRSRAAGGCGHDGWRAGCAHCESQEQLALDVMGAST